MPPSKTNMYLLFVFMVIFAIECGRMSNLIQQIVAEFSFCRTCYVSRLIEQFGRLGYRSERALPACSLSAKMPPWSKKWIATCNRVAALNK
jgi:hypothetical protein